jgi:nucleoside phosphorylase
VNAPREPVAIFAALRWECSAVLHHLHQVRRQRLGDFTCWQGRASGREVWLVKTGVGIARARAAADALGDPSNFALLVSTGCAGGLAPELRPGDLVVATAVSCDGTTVPTDLAPRSAAMAAAATAGVRAFSGSVLCSATVLASAGEKHAAAAAGTIAVDMEGGPIAARAAGARVPFMWARTVLDGADHELTLQGGFIDPGSGNVRPLALAAYLVTHPTAVGDLLAVRRMQLAARDNLTRFFAAWFAAPGPGGS